MDLLHWSNINEDIKTHYTKKLYFNRHLWRLEYEVAAAHLVSDHSVRDIALYLNHQRSNPINPALTYHRYGGWSRKNWDGVDVDLLNRIRAARNSLSKDRVTFRIESNRVNVFADSEEDLKEFHELIDCNELLSITYPKEGSEAILLGGAVFMGPKTNFKYKIILSDGEYDRETKARLYKLLSENPDVRMTDNMVRMLQRSFKFMWNCYFYANDSSMTTMMSLIAPGIIKKIHAIEHLQ